jgi:4-amino-4-deoxy-L-arabinose transferase-like glycosyltransferase
MRRRLRAAAWPAYALLGLVVAVGFVLRVDNNGYGLPYVYNVDEGSHFTARAVGMLGGDWSPHYFQNPSAFTYLANFALRLRFGHGNPFGSFGSVIDDYKIDPTAIYTTTRTLSAALCMLGVVAVFWAARRLWDTGTGLAAAAVLSFAFLPVVYSRIAVTDVGTLAPVAVALWGAVRAWEGGALRHWIVAGAAAGLAIGFKYTAGLVLLALLVPAIGLIVRDRRAALVPVLAGGAAALVACVAAFFITNPYFFIDFADARRQLSAQATTAGDFGKVGQEGPGAVYYLKTLTWGLGWVVALAALAGALLELRRDVVRGLILVVFPLALFAYLSLQARFFGRWLLPAYPALAMLAAAALAQAANAMTGAIVRRRASRRAPGPVAAFTVARAARPPRYGFASAVALAVLVAIALAQPFAAGARTAVLLGRADTRQIARDWLVRNHPGALRVVIEPAVPARYYRRQGRGGLRGRKAFVRGFAKHQAETRVQYPSLLKPQYVDAYRRMGFCLVMTMSVIKDRAVTAELGPALAYYDRLARESDVVFHASPYDRGATPPRFDFDLSYNYYPPAFRRPGPEVTIYRLHDCRQRYGPLPKGVELPGGIS